MMSTLKEHRTSYRVSELVKQFEAKSKPPEKKINLLRGICRSKTTPDKLRAHKDAYCQKLEQKKCATWYVKPLISDGSEESTDSNGTIHKTQTLQNLTSSLTKYFPESVQSSADVVKQNDYKINDAKYPTRPSTAPNNLDNNLSNGKKDVLYSERILPDSDDIEYRISVIDIKLSNNRNIAIIRSRNDLRSIGLNIINCENIKDNKVQSDDEISFDLSDQEIKRTSDVVSWIRDSQFAGEDNDKVEEPLPVPQPRKTLNHSNNHVYENVEIYSEPIKSKRSSTHENRCENNQKVDINDNVFIETTLPESSYENVEIYRKNLQRDMVLIDIIQNLEDNDEEVDSKFNHEEDVFEDSNEIEQVGTMPYAVDEIDLLNKRKVELLEDNSGQLEDLQNLNHKFDIDEPKEAEIDVTNTGMFGEGKFVCKLLTSYLEVINPLFNKNTPTDCSNEVIHLTLIPIDIAKYIDNIKDVKEEFDVEDNQRLLSDEDMFEVTTQYNSQDSLNDEYRGRYDSTHSMETLPSDDCLPSTPEHDYHSSIEEVHKDLIRTDSKLVRVDQTYYNNKLRITKNIVLRDLTNEKPKSEHIVDELINTERSHLSKLEYVRDKYMPPFHDSIKYPSLGDKAKYLFLNWNGIYCRACKFFEQIESCEYNYEKLADTILNSVKLFEEYSLYCKNKVLADKYMHGEVREVAEKIQSELDDKLGLSTYLVEPVQRLTKYILLLESLKKELNKTGECHKLRDAIDMIKRITTESNDCIAASHINHLPFALKDKGRIIRKDTFDVVCERPKTKWTNVELFLFEKVLIIAAPNSADEYIYKDSILMDHMRFYSDDKMFTVEDYVKNKDAKDKRQQKFICTCKNPEIATEWKSLLTNQLMKQFNEMKDQMKLNQEIPKGRSQLKSNSVFYT